MLTRVAIVLILFHAVLPLAAEPAADNSYHARVWLAEDGLPENRVIGVAQATDGYLWVATQAGAARFDGVRFQLFGAATTAGKVTGYMQAIYLDHAGRLWLGKEQGVVVCIEGARVSAWTADDGLPQFEAQRSMADDNEGGLWISYSRGTVLRLKDGRVTKFSRADGLPAEGAGWLTRDRDGQLWFAKDGQVGVFRDGKFQTMTEVPGVTRMATARGGGVWLCTWQALFRFNPGGPPVKICDFPVSGVSAEPTAMIEDRWGAVWVGTVAAGLFRCDSNGVVNDTLSPSTPSPAETNVRGRFGGGEGQIVKVATSHPAILSLAEDLEGNLWVGTRGGGLDRLQRRVVRLAGAKEGLPFESVQSLCQDASGNLWAVGQNAALARRQGERWSLSGLAETARGLNPTCVTADARGAVYIGSRGGSIYRWQDGQFKNLNLRDQLRQAGVRSLLATTSGDLWIATDANHLYRLRDGQLRGFNLPPGYRFIRAMAEDAAGNFWLGASDGLLMRVTGDELFNETQKPFGFSIRYLYGAPDGSLWIGYAGFGVGRLKDGKLTYWR